MNQLLIATANQGKLREIRALLAGYLPHVAHTWETLTSYLMSKRMV